jgi:hypothetical protein
MSNDRFWKLFAIIALCALFTNAYVYFRLNRYHTQNVRYVLDKWNGKIYSISQLQAK